MGDMSKKPNDVLRPTYIHSSIVLLKNSHIIYIMYSNVSLFTGIC